MNIFLSFFFSILMLFGTGSTREQALSAKYQDGSWSGSSTGIPAAYVENGLLYVDGKVSDYPADSSVSYCVTPIITTDKGTWFMEKSATNSVCVLRLDSRGTNLKTLNFSTDTYGAEKVETIVNTEEQTFDLKIWFPEWSGKGIKVYTIPFDPC